MAGSSSGHSAFGAGVTVTIVRISIVGVTVAIVGSSGGGVFFSGAVEGVCDADAVAGIVGESTGNNVADDVGKKTVTIPTVLVGRPVDAGAQAVSKKTKVMT